MVRTATLAIIVISASTPATAVPFEHTYLAAAVPKPLLSAMAKARRGLTQSSRFGSPVVFFSGGETTLEIKPVDEQETGRAYMLSSTWGYKDGALSFDLDLSRPLYVKVVQHEPGSYKAHNGLGASIEISPDIVDIDQVTIAENLTTVSAARAHVVIPANGAEARSLSQSIRMDVEMNLPEQAIKCSSEHLRPTYESPEDVTTNTCGVSATIVSIDFVDSRTKAVVAHWGVK